MTFFLCILPISLIYKVKNVHFCSTNFCSTYFPRQLWSFWFLRANVWCKPWKSSYYPLMITMLRYSHIIVTNITWYYKDYYHNVTSTTIELVVSVYSFWVSFFFIGRMLLCVFLVQKESFSSCDYDYTSHFNYTQSALNEENWIYVIQNAA